MSFKQRRSLADGSQGVTHDIPSGDLVSCDGEQQDFGLTVHDIPGRLQWSFKFFENLHMDLSSLSEEEEQRREAAIER
ncbi:MAG: hypothetical protein SGARI_006998, partial [Bacillariaceae sp.]